MHPPRADLVRDLARALRSEHSVVAALASWTDRSRHIPAFARCHRRLRLGIGVLSAIAPLSAVLGDDATALGALLVAGHRTGAPVAPAIASLAAAIDARERDRDAAFSAATAARNSARVMVLMPALAAPLLAFGGLPVSDATGIGSAAGAGALMYAAWRWIDRLVPTPPADDDGTRFCELLACALAGGLHPATACAEVASLFPEPTRTPARLHRLGLTWPEALMRSEHQIVRDAGALLMRMERSGIPVARELSLIACERRLVRRRAFDVAVKAAPIRMIWPLVVCSLPAFCVLTVVPLARGIASSL